MSYEQIFRDLTERLGSELTEKELALVVEAFEFAREAHAGQVRDEGTPYIVHPVRVAATLVHELEVFSPRLVCAALLHDVIEEGHVPDKSSSCSEERAEVVGC
jgi:GTP pyrophosphokinase